MTGYGYGGGGGDRSRSASSSRSPHRERRKGEKKAKGKKRRRNREEAAPEDEPSRAAPRTGGAAPAEVGTLPQAGQDGRRGAWREELETGPATTENETSLDGGMVVVEETEEDVDRALAASRARREALIAKWVNRGEGPEGGLAMPDTRTSLEGGESESDGEADAFFAARREEMSKKEPEDQETMKSKKAVTRFIMQFKAEHDGDMFNESAEGQDALNANIDQSAAIGQTGASADDWNDKDGYYRAQIKELMNDRYLVTENKCGQGVFSNVLKAKDQQTNEMVAIKVMRCNDMMRKAAEKEVEILERLNKADKGNKRNVIRLFTTFVYRDHLCLVFECMWDNLRMALKKYTKDKGMSLKAVRAYTKQLLVALQHIHRCEIIHADIKPDNILISAGHNITKICDLGSAFEVTEAEQTPYLVSRFYRAPEIVLGAKYGPPCDTFALGATLFEIFTGKILFPGKSNNDMLRHFMDLKGKIPHKMIKSGMTWKQHFDENLDFKYLSTDKATRKKTTKVITDCSAKKSMLELIMDRVGAEKQKSTSAEDQWYVRKAKEFADLLNQMTVLDPEKRASPTDLLLHPFVAETVAKGPKR